jgi:hypothetical protein
MMMTVVYVFAGIGLATVLFIMEVVREILVNK